jgi:hypothetical protein
MVLILRFYKTNKSKTERDDFRSKMQIYKKIAEPKIKKGSSILA